MKHCLRMFQLQVSAHINLPKIVLQLRSRYQAEKFYHARKKLPSHK